MTKTCFIFVANDIPLSPQKKFSADEIANTLLSQGFWAFSEQAPLRKKLFEQDELLIYLAGHERKHFVATAQVAKTSDKITEDERKILKQIGLSFMQYRVLLSNIQRLEPYVKIKPLIPELSFIKDKKNYGLHLRLPIVRCKREDYERILKKTNVVAWA